MESRELAVNDITETKAKYLEKHQDECLEVITHKNQ
jgi:hypothetical protein